MATLTITQNMIDAFTTKNATLYKDTFPAYVGATFATNNILTAKTTGANKFDAIRYEYQNPSTGVMGQYNFTVNAQDPTTATYKWLSTGVAGGWFTVTESPYLSGKITQTAIDAAAADNCEILVDGAPAIGGMGVGAGQTVTYQTVGNFVIDGAYFEFQNPNTGGMNRVDLTINTPPTSAFFIWANRYPSSFYGANVTTTPFTPEVTGSNRVYVLADDDLADLNDQRFYMPPNNDQVIDYGQYILGLVQLPFELPAEYIEAPDNVQLGDLETTVNVPVVNVDKLPVSLGEISVPAPEGNLLDFSGVVCNLHLPRTNAVVLAADYVIGQTIGVEYLIDLYSGEATINVTSSKVGGKVFFTKTTTLGIDIPYIHTTDTANISNSNIDVGGDNRITTPFIEVLKNEAVLVDGFFTIPIVDESLLGGKIGYIEVEKIDLKTDATLSERQNIVNLLKDGVIIK